MEVYIKSCSVAEIADRFSTPLYELGIVLENKRSVLSDNKRRKGLENLV